MTQTLRFKIVLIHSKPVIWRTFEIPDNYRLDRFHQVLQIVMGWNNSHLHEFRINGRSIGMILDDDFTDQFPVEDETKIYLSDFNFEERDTLSYLYDFGDYWEHILYVQQVSTSEIISPICTVGERACPPDDCGAISGYMKILDIFKHKIQPEYDEWMAWLPEGFHPDKFPKDEINKELEAFGIWHRKHPRKKSTPWHQI